MPDTRPTDLIAVDDAARRVDRSKSTIRAWVRSGALVGYREDPMHPENSRLMVSVSALQSLVVVTGKVANPGRPQVPAADDVSPDVVSLKAELEVARMGIADALRGQVDVLEGRVQDLLHAVQAERTRAEEWRGRALSAEAEREALRKEKGLPWWRRLLGVNESPQPLLDGGYPASAES